MRSGGEFSSLFQNTFHHYRDFWVFDITTHAWDRIDLKVMPTARSGHRYVPPQRRLAYLTSIYARFFLRMAMWKHFIILFGGFNDPGIISKCLA